MNWLYNYTLRYLVDAINAPILARLTILENAMHEEFAKVIAAMNDETNQLAAKLDALVAQLAGGLSASEATDALVQLTAISGRRVTNSRAAGFLL